ncbi:MAG: glycosyltransferase family 2 protein [Mariprofundaceae bacterium]|nr:glycosyltransferase family 2 protein [Mariprofundaceae bacterium]
MQHNTAYEIDLSVVIACYNEAEHIEQSLPTLEASLQASGLVYELIVIDDCSADHTAKILHQLFDHRDDVQVIFHAENQGRGATVQEGLMLASGEVIGFLDIDLEVGPWYILPAIDHIKRHQTDMIVAHRIYKLQMHPTVLTRHILSVGYRILVHAMLDVPIRDSEAGFKFFRRSTIMPVLEKCQDKGWFWDTEVVYLAHLKGLKLNEIPCLFLRRPEKTSTVNLVADTWQYFKSLRAFQKRLDR